MDLALQQERVDDIPVLLAQLREMGVPQLLDECFPTHANWRGLSLGYLVTVWLAFILAEGNHRVRHLREWAAARSHTLRAGLRASSLSRPISPTTAWRKRSTTCTRRPAHAAFEESDMSSETTP